MSNHPLVSHIFTADPSAHVFNGKLYIYPSHDIATDIEDNDNGIFQPLSRFTLPFVPILSFRTFLSTKRSPLYEKDSSLQEQN